MYKIYHQIDREKRREQDEKENAIVTDNEIRQVEALYNVSLRRDSFSTITTHDTEIIQKQVHVPPSKKLLPITWGGMNGELPLVISVPETPKNKIFLDDREPTETYLPPCVRSEEDDDDPYLLPTSLFVDDDEELDLIFDDNQEEDEMNAQRVVGNPAPFETSSTTSKNSGSYLETEKAELHTEVVSFKPEELVRFETERFTRFEI